MRRNTFMKNTFNFFLTGVFCLLIFSVNSSLSAAPRKTEAELIQMLYSGDYHKINDALDRLPNWYPDSTNAVQVIRGILKSNEVMVASQPAHKLPPTKNGVSGGSTARPLPPDRVSRIAARALGKYHATLNEDELDIIYNLLNSPDNDSVVDALKALRGLNAPQAVPKILPLLHAKDTHVVRDACRTLAVLGNTNTIPFIEPLLKDLRSDVRQDAQEAIKTLKAK